MTERSKRLAWLAVGAALVVPAAGVAGCGDDDDEDGGATSTSTETAAGPATGGQGGTINVSETDFALNPANPTVKAGTVTINATNDSQTPHAIEVEGPNGEEQSDTIPPGGIGKLTVDLSKPGTYEWYCPIDGHKDQGMEGEITVE